MKTHLAIILVGLLVWIVPGHAVARASGRDDTAAAEKVKAKRLPSSVSAKKSGRKSNCGMAKG